MKYLREGFIDTTTDTDSKIQQQAIINKPVLLFEYLIIMEVIHKEIEFLCLLMSRHSHITRNHAFVILFVCFDASNRVI